MRVKGRLSKSSRKEAVAKEQEKVAEAGQGSDSAVRLMTGRVKE